jgi:hypothetical protein
MNNTNHISESLETIFGVKILKFFDAVPGWKKFGSGINIPQHCLKLTYSVLMTYAGNFEIVPGLWYSSRLLEYNGAGT